MNPLRRIYRFELAVLAVAGLFVLATIGSLAQSPKLPSPTTYISDPAGVIDPQTRQRLETMLAGLKAKAKIELYVAMVDGTGGQEISIFSQRLADDWKIGSKNSRPMTLLLVVSAASKSSFTQFSRSAQNQLPDGVLGEMSYRMRGPLSEGRFTEAIDSGVHVFVNALAQKIGFNVADLEPSVVATSSAPTASDSPQPVLVSATNKTRPRLVSEAIKAQDPQPSPTVEPTPAETPKVEPTPEPTPSESPKVEPTPAATPSETPKVEPTPSETPKVAPTPATTTEPVKTEPTEAPTTETPKTSSTKPPARKLTSKGTTTIPNKPAAPATERDDEETVSLTLTLPLDKRIVELRQFLDTYPDSKERARAIEYLVSAHAALGDRMLKNGDNAGVEHLLRAIDETDPTISDQLFTGVISQIPANLYLRGEREAAFKASRNIENKFGTDPKRLLALTGFYLGIERGDEAIRLAESAIKLAPDMAEAHRMMALGLHISLRLDEAAAEYKRTLELDPTSKVSRNSLADIYRASGKSEQALALYNEELASDPKDRAARAGKVVSLLELSRLDEANTELEAALTEEPRNLPLLTGAAYWFAAHGNNEKAFDLARKAVAVESRYTWAQIALARAYLGLKQPLDAERAMRYARQYGKFPTLNYELANVLVWMGLYQEAADVLSETFAIKDGQIQTRLAGHLPASDAGFVELLAPERRAGIFQSSSPDTAANAKIMKALLAFNTAITPAEGEKINEPVAVAAAQEFASGNDSMRAFRQLYAASRLLRNGIGVPAVLELVAEARKGADDALNVPVLTMAVQADEYRDLRARAIAAGSIPDVAEAPRNVMENILKGRIEDLEGWALFNSEKYPEAIEHLKQASQVLPANTPAWRSALWHLGVAHEQIGQKEQALDYYIQSYQGGDADPVRKSLIEQLYKKINGSLEGFESRLTATATEPPKTEASPSPAPAAAEPTPAAAEPTPAPAPAPETAQPVSDESLRNAASRLRSNIKITGRVTDTSNAALPNVTVVLISPSGSVLAATTDSEGNYSFTVAPSQKTYRVIPSRDGYTFTPVDKTFAALIDDQRNVDFVGSKP